MRIATTLLALAATGFLAACSSEEECTEELATKKMTELQTKLTELAASDPAKAAEAATKMQELATKAAADGTDPSAACKMVDDLMAEISK
jgi:hypothetical protein